MSLHDPEDLEQSAAFQALEAYPWDQDVEFQSGLSAILGAPGASFSSAEAEDLAIRARCFYFSRKTALNIDIASYKAWKARQTSPSVCVPSNLASASATAEQFPTVTTHDEVIASDPSTIRSGANATTSSQADYPASFDEIIELIRTGKPIPGIKEIPNTVLAGQGTQARQNRRPKPWERAGEPDQELGGTSKFVNGKET